MRWVWMSLLALAAGFSPGAALGKTNSDLAKEVREAEIAFARTLAERKLDAFATYVSEEAVFFGRQGALRGREAVVAGWKPLFEADKAPFSWSPESVEVLDSGTLAHSCGPVLDPDDKRTGMFNSIWRLEADGRWRVIFDKGCPVCDQE